MITQKVRMQIADLAEKYGYEAGIMPSEALNGWRAGHELIVIAPKSVKKSIKNLNSTIIAIIGEGSVFNHHKVVLADNPKYAMVHVEREGKKVDQYLGTANSDSELVERIQEQLVWVTIPKRAIETSAEPKGVGSVPKVPAALQKFANEVGAYAYLTMDKQGGVSEYIMTATPTDNYLIVVVEDVSKTRGGNIFRGKWQVGIGDFYRYHHARNTQEIIDYLSSHKEHIKNMIRKRKNALRQSDDGFYVEQRGVGRVKRITGYAVVPEKVLITGVKGAKNKIMLVPEVEVNIVGRLEKNLPQIKDANSAASIIRDVMSQKYPNKIGTQEIFGYAFLNNQNQVLGIYWQAIGSQTGVVTDLGLFTSAMAATAARSVIAFHNHPSGNTQPSEADKILSRRIKALCETYTANYLDCLVLTKYGFYSFAENGIL